MLVDLFRDLLVGTLVGLGVGFIVIGDSDVAALYGALLIGCAAFFAHQTLRHSGMR